MGYNRIVNDICQKLKGGVFMPGRDGTGPLDYGAATGRGLGQCGGEGIFYCANGYGRGLARRHGFGGRGIGTNAYSAVSQTREELLLKQKSMLQSQIKAIESQLKDL